jgi:hypothetical protein
MTVNEQNPNQNETQSQTQAQTGNEELTDLGTHAFANTTQHKTRTDTKNHTIEPPVVDNPGPYDTRTGNHGD